MGTQLDPQLAHKIVHEVKSQGVFDEFRKDSIADVDTKPAYLNLRQRVENAVQKFLSEQRWTPETNKYQLRERLRRHIAESGFLDVGVERIVDQVVNPKIGSVFTPRIEEIAYKFLGLPPPLIPKRELAPPPLPLPPYPINGNPEAYEKSNTFDTLKIETIPVDGENLLPKDLEQISPESDKIAVKEEDTQDTIIDDDKVDDDDESPPFEPLTECKSPIKIENEIKEELEAESAVKSEIKSELETSAATVESLKVPQKESSPIKEEATSVDALASQESQLSQVSSDSRISSASNLLNQSGSDAPTISDNAAAANISEEAQMPKFNENSTDLEGNSKNISDLHFDIMKNENEIKFEGTERKTNLLDGEHNNESSIKDAPIIKDAYISESIEAKGAFHFTKLNVEVEPCNVSQEAASSVSSQDDTSSAQLCIVEKSEQDMLQADTSSVQKASQDESNVASLNNNNNSQQNKINDEKQKPTSSSSSFSRHKKSSTSSKDKGNEKEKSRRHDDKDQRERSSKHYERPSDSKHSTKIASSSSRHHSSSERHSSSSKRNEKSSHRSSSSRSESHSRHSSSKKDHRYDDKKHRSSSSHSKSSRSENHKSRIIPPNDDHNESKEKIRWRKSTDSNDEDKSPTAGSSANGTTNNNKSSSENATTTTATGSNTSNTKSTNHESSKHSNRGNKEIVDSDIVSTDEPKETAMMRMNNSNVVVLNDVLENPSKGFVEIVSNQITKTENQEKFNLSDADEDDSDEKDTDLLYFEQTQNPLKKKLSLLDEAIDRCNDCYKATSIQQKPQQPPECTNSKLNFNEFISKINLKSNNNNNNNNNEIDNKQQKTQATLQIDCYHYPQQQQQLDCENGDENKATSAKRFKYDNTNTDCGMSKENQMNEKNAIKTDTDVKKSTSNRVDLIAKQQQQRYRSEDLYKPRPVLSQRSKRRGFDALT